MSKTELEESLDFIPRFDEKGLIPCITSCANTGDVLMFAFMNEEALNKTIKTGEAHYWSRSRKALWHKGQSSGYTQKIVEMRTDCDQDCIWIKVKVNTPSNNKSQASACHTGRKSCFYRRIKDIPNNTDDVKLGFVDAERLFNPEDVYK